MGLIFLFIFFILQSNFSRFGGGFGHGGGRGFSGGARHQGGRTMQRFSHANGKKINHQPSHNSLQKKSGRVNSQKTGNNHNHNGNNNHFNNNNNNYAGWAGGGWGLGMGFATAGFLGLELGMMASMNNASPTYITNITNVDDTDTVITHVGKKKIINSKKKVNNDKEYKKVYNQFSLVIDNIQNVSDSLSEALVLLKENKNAPFIIDNFSPFNTLLIIPATTAELFGISENKSEPTKTVKFTRNHKINNILDDLKKQANQSIEEIVKLAKVSHSEMIQYKTNDLFHRLRGKLIVMNDKIVEIVEAIKKQR